MTTAAERYAELCDAVWEQWGRLFGPPAADIWDGPAAAQFRFDPHRELDANLEILASYVGPEDVVVDVGGGAGRVSLPLALRCREVVTVEPSPGMAAEYQSLAQESRITNARLLPQDWMETEGVEGAVVLTCDVTYFVRDIVPFIEKMQAAARRRVMITVWSEPPPNRGADLVRRIYGEPQAPMPGHRELLPVLWDMGILPDVRVLPEPSWWEDWRYPTREEAIEATLFPSRSGEAGRERARRVLEEQFDELFAPDNDGGYRVLWRQPMRELLITWETG
jgi:SAM-dependent methyltransferase